MKKLLLFLSSLSIIHFSFAQDSCSLRISLLTCSPGEALYSTFGHTAVRVQDAANGTDYVFNYGTFEFEPGFYTRFIRGKLLYFLSIEEFSDFVYLYRLESRSIREQVILAKCSEKQKIYAALRRNAQEENRYYRYDFLFDNCTTRAGDIIANHMDSPVVFRNILPSDKLTFRNQIHSYLNAGHQYWSKLGIDILLGVKLDRQVTNREAMFLPDYLLKGFDSATIQEGPLADAPQVVLAMPSPLEQKSVLTPGLLFSILVIIIAGISLLRSGWATQATRLLDFLLFFMLGLAGLLILFMWFATDHTVCRNNYNILWALPTHVVAAFFIHGRKNWVRYYFKVVLWISTALAITWFFLPQQMNNALLPVVLLTIYRSWYLSKKGRS